MALSTKNIPTGIQKTLLPGINVVTINSINIEPFKFKEGAYEVHIHVEGPAIKEPGFVGFNIDKNDASLGTYAGQIGRVKASLYAYADGETKTGIPVSRDQNMLKFLMNLCKELDIQKWFDEQDNKHETIEDLYEQFKIDAPYKGKKVRMCIAAKEYVNQAGFTAFDLFLPKAGPRNVVIELESVPTAKSRLLPFKESEHVIVKKDKPVENFGEDTPTEDVNDELAL